MNYQGDLDLPLPLERAWGLGVADQKTSSSCQGPEDSELLVNLHGRCELLLTRISQSGWHELDNRYIDKCTSLPSEW